MWSTNPEETTQRTATTPGNFTPYSFRIVCGFFNVPHWTYINMEGIVRPGSNSRPPAWQPDAQLTEPPVRTVNTVTSNKKNNEKNHKSTSYNENNTFTQKNRLWWERELGLLYHGLQTRAISTKKFVSSVWPIIVLTHVDDVMKCMSISLKKLKFDQLNSML